MPGLSAGLVWRLGDDPQMRLHSEAGRSALFFDYGGARVDPRSRASVVTQVEAGILIEGEGARDTDEAAIQRLAAIGLARARNPVDRDGLEPHNPTASVRISRYSSTSS